MTTHAKPVGPRVLVLPLEASESMHAGIVLPIEVAQGEARGVVQAVGHFYRDYAEDGPVEVPIGIQAGNTVVYQRGSGIEVSLDLQGVGVFEKFLVLDMKQLLLVLEEV